ncbi:MAG: hypothetical protein JO316_10715 [Abitibacteriaceae bacterium]|nr:hypothetical protein [Abditibacteriaceae bacterium]
MSAFLIVLNPRGVINALVNGKALAGAEEVLDALATQLGVPPLMDFYSTNPDNLPEEVAALVATFSEEWFEAGAGLTTIRALLSYLENHSLEGINTGAVMIDLMQFEQVLTKAAAQGVRWHLEVDY